MEFLSIPVEVIDAFVLPNLEWGDILRFRRVCKTAKDITNGYLKVHPERVPEIEINEADKNFRAFLKMGIPASRIFINNPSGDELYQAAGDDAVGFVTQFGPVVKHLRVKQISRYLYGNEWSFMEGLVNLESLQADYFGYGRKVGPEEIQTVLADKQLLERQDRLTTGRLQPLPNAFKKLTVLKIGHNQDMVFEDFLDYADAFRVYFSWLQQLEYIAIPLNLNVIQRPLFDTIHPYTRSDIRLVNYAMGMFGSRISEELPTRKLKAIDFGAYHGAFKAYGAGFEDNVWTTVLFGRLCSLCIKNGVKLVNVQPMWYRDQVGSPNIVSAELGTPVVSLVNLHPCILALNMPNLERIEIRSTARSSSGSDWRRRPDWPALKVLDITVDSQLGTYVELNHQPPTRAHYPITILVWNASLFQFFFKDITRPALTELRLSFTTEESKLVFPKLQDISSSCPNLRKLTLVKWPGTSEDLAGFWAELPSLEEICLECCEGLKDVAFIGPDAKNPVFLKLTNLKKFSLKGLDAMPGITDALFSTVIRHLKLTHLTLTSDTPIKSVTIAGVHALLQGNFAASIEKFSFRHWSLEHVSERLFKTLEQEFRSFYML